MVFYPGGGVHGGGGGGVNPMTKCSLIDFEIPYIKFVLYTFVPI